MPDSIGDPRKQHPIPMRLRNANVPKEQGGSFGYRGSGFTKMRERILAKAKYRSTNTGMPAEQVGLEVDHIIPYRVGGGLTPHTNEESNLRVTDMTNNKYSDNAETFKEKPAKRRMTRF
jgi:hypothetical protein